MTFHAGVESAITRLLYKHPSSSSSGEQQDSLRLGFPSPVYGWVHNAFTASSAIDLEADMTLVLIRHIIRNAGDDIAPSLLHVVCGSLEVQNAIRHRLLTSSFAPARAAALVERVVGIRDLASKPSPAAVVGLGGAPTVSILCMGGYASAHIADNWRGPHCTQAFGLSSAALIIIGHSLWTTACPAPHPIGVGFRKLAAESWGCGNPRIESKGLVGGVLPLCCGEHHEQTTFVTVDGAKGFSAGEVCKRLCLQPFACHRSHHVCTQRCHTPSCCFLGVRSSGSQQHVQCDFTCGRRLPCGHPCRMRCGEPCDCLEIVRRDLECFHEVAVGPKDDATGKAPLRRHPHAFEGPCILSREPCEVPVPLTCRACNSTMHLPCHIVSAARTAADESPNLDLAAMLCPDCVDLQRKLRNEVLAELLGKAEAMKAHRKHEVESQLHEQTRSAKAGVFHEGQRVEIKDLSGIRGRVDELFPEVASHSTSGNGWCELDWEELIGEHGTVVSRCVDFVDTNEVLYLVALARGGHTVVADKGLGLLKGVVVHHTGYLDSRPAKEDIGSSSILLITGGPSGYTSGKEPVEEKEATQELSVAARFPLASPVFCTAPSLRLPPNVSVEAHIARSNNHSNAAAPSSESEPCPPPEPLDDDGVHPERESNVFGRVVAVHNNNVYIECIRDKHYVVAAHSNDDEAPAKRCRSEGEQRTGAAEAEESSTSDDEKIPEVRTTEERFILMVSSDKLEPLLRIGESCIVREPQRHINSVDERRFFVSLERDHWTFRPVPLTQGESCTVRGIVNYPRIEAGVTNIWTKNRGPCYILSSKRDERRTSDARRIAIAPIIFADIDAEARVEAELNQELVALLEKQVQERFDALAEQRYIRNVEIAAKKHALAARMKSTRSLTEPRVEYWGGGAKLSAAASQRKLEHTARSQSEKGDVTAAIRRDAAAASAATHGVADFMRQFVERTALLHCASEELQRCAAKAPQK